MTYYTLVKIYDKGFNDTILRECVIWVPTDIAIAAINEDITEYVDMPIWEQQDAFNPKIDYSVKFEGICDYWKTSPVQSFKEIEGGYEFTTNNSTYQLRRHKG